MKNSLPTSIAVAISLIAAMIFWSNYDFWTMAGLSATLLVFLVFLNRLATTIPVLEMMLLISALQWIFGAHQSFNFEFQHYKYYMYVDRFEYMGIIVPGFICFVAGILIIKSNLDIQEVNRRMIQFVTLNPKAPIILVGIGFASPIIGQFAPPAIGFVFFLLGNLKFIGAALWLFQPESARKWIVTAGILLLTFLSSVQA